ncbi:MAG: hypothetical protein ACRDQW_12060, partial [Haloechinothrix sp.]
MSPRARLAVLALVLVGAFIAVRVRQAAVGSGMAEAQPLPPAGEGTRAALTWLMVLTIPLLALLFVVALRFPRQRARPDAQRWTRATWRGLALMVALLLLIAAVLALAGRIPSTRLSPEDPTPDGPHGTTTRAPSTGRRPPADGDWAPLDIDGMVVFVVGALAALMIAAAIGNR